MKRSKAYQDPVGELIASGDEIDSRLASWSNNISELVVAHIVNGVPIREIANRIGQSTYWVASNIEWALRNSSGYRDLEDDYWRPYEKPSDGFRENLRESLRTYGPETVTRCEHCESPIVLHPNHLGRPRRFCRNACRQAAYRARKQTALTPMTT